MGRVWWVCAEGLHNRVDSGTICVVPLKLCHPILSRVGRNSARNTIGVAQQWYHLCEVPFKLCHPILRTLHTAQNAVDTKWVAQQWVACGLPSAATAAAAAGAMGPISNPAEVAADKVSKVHQSAVWY